MAKNLWLIVLAIFLSVGFYGFLLIISPGFEMIKFAYETLTSFGISTSVIYATLISAMVIIYFVEFGIFVQILKCDA